MATRNGTNALELRLWKAAGIDPKTGAGTWYRDIGGGMGAALNAAAAMPAYTLSDRGTWISFKNKGSLEIVVEGDPALLNRYDVIELNPATHSAAKLESARLLATWLTTQPGQDAIGAYLLAGRSLFHPSAASPRSRVTSGASGASPNPRANRGASPKGAPNKHANTGASSPSLGRTANPIHSTSRRHLPDAP